MIDKDFSRKMLDELNSNRLKLLNVSIKSFPDKSQENIFNIAGNAIKLKFKKQLVENNLKKYINNFSNFLKVEEDDFYIFTGDELESLGLALYPYLSFGILNGGSATSYVDILKNSDFNKELYLLYESKILEAKRAFKDLPKGITPAYLNKDGSYGFSFLELKIRHLLKLSKRYMDIYGVSLKPSIFQMTSFKTDAFISKFLDNIFYEDLVKSLNYSFLKKEDILTAIQPLVYCYRKLDNGQYVYFDYEMNGEKIILALPAGHGQNFRVLRDIYFKLYKSGKRFVYIGNIDNIGFTVNLKALAIMAIINSSSGFEFSVKTALDTKGGILIIDKDGRLTCVDIGGAISKEDVLKAEDRGDKILFNCATGLFNLEYLVKNIDRIIEEIPSRVIEQNKEIGQYFSIEQVTWEVVKLVDDPLIFEVNRENRFLPAKLFIDILIASCYLQDKFSYNISYIANYLNNSLNYLLKNDYGLVFRDGKWNI
ncbi:UTP--glucose-1-phosphate uridylyltransferase [Borrelia sp. A-FGy1]|uniref:UTP--glucose-1-phosphate uridylyltransferase n=1 Tax=Borrelia sp. A-FGy1 TaxID=2608247 RepID=UPI0015F3C253|nr:UTP--glucose-1-phosphate uridylyltransferase [Borrelia sp. A-FGy1]QMU99586.1 UTP--glucose-1-phosphate uridylyltransferase [Borrelia sp. A-FGy1]